MIFTFKIELRDSNAWRRVEAAGSYGFHRLHRTIQVSFGRSDHFRYYFKGSRYKKPFLITEHAMAQAEDFMDSRKIRLKDFFLLPGQEVIYVYDLKVKHTHRVLLESVRPGEMSRPLCLDAEGEGPAEKLPAEKGIPPAGCNIPLIQSRLMKV